VNKLQTAFERLFQYLITVDFKGWDCYDGLNSRLFQATPFRHSRIIRLAWIQLLKRSPINLRPLLGVPTGDNPKGLALFLSGCLNCYQATQDETYRQLSLRFIAELHRCQSMGWCGAGWGYNFDWQARAFYQPKYTPNIVVTSFVGDAFLLAYKILGEDSYLTLARRACEFILRDLNRTGTEDSFCFSYSPQDQSQVFNASLLGVRLLSRVYCHTQDSELIETAQKAVRFCLDHQNPDGSWFYSPLAYQQWIDSFHTGYNLECLYAYQSAAQDFSGEAALLKGLRYYRTHFFLDDYTPTYYHNQLYPIDVHCPAQAVMTFITLRQYCDFDVERFCRHLLEWTVDQMQDPQRGYFYFQKTKWFTNKIPYIRWSQAWMFYALAYYLNPFNTS